MRTTRCIAALAALLALAAPAAHAQIFRAYLTLDGNDANPCTLSQPCRLLPAALAAVASGGEIWMLDSANYNTGPVTVSKSVTILAIPGALGSVVALGGDALNITTTGPVTLRNLNILPFPGSENFTGVRKQSAGKLLIQDSNIFRFVGAGTGVTVIGAADVTITRTVIRDNGLGIYAANGAVMGISDSLFTGNDVGANATTAAAGFSTTVSVTRTVARTTGIAFWALGSYMNSTVVLRVTDSRIECSTGGIGVAVSHVTATGVAAQGTVSDTTISGCESGVEVVGPNTVKVFLAGNTITDNLVGVNQVDLAIVESAGNNAIRNNGTNVQGTMTNVGSM